MSFVCNNWNCPCQQEDGRGVMGLAENAYTSLSVEEHFELSDELHGVREITVPESPEFVESKLDELNRELHVLSKDCKKYYAKAIEIEQRILQVGGEAYIGSKQFRLQFLRAERFDAHAAAHRLAEYFKHKFELFGEENLARRIQQVDLSNQDKEALVSGVLTYTGVSDSVGRPIVIFRRSNMFLLPVRCAKRIFFYTFQKVIEENEVAQKLGIVMLAYHMGMPHLIHPFRVVKVYLPVMRMIKHGLPFRHAALHVYYRDMKEHLVLNLGLVVLPKEERARVLTHFKHTHEDCMVNAILYGIEPDDLPLTAEGDFKYDEIRSFWENQKQLEDEPN